MDQSYERAAEYYEAAARQGHADAQYNLGQMYRKGQGVDQSYERVGFQSLRVSGAHELRRYLTFAEASGMFVADATAADGGCAHCSLLSDTIYSKMLPKYVELERKNADGPVVSVSSFRRARTILGALRALFTSCRRSTPLKTLFACGTQTTSSFEF